MNAMLLFSGSLSFSKVALACLAVSSARTMYHKTSHIIMSSWSGRRTHLPVGISTCSVFDINWFSFFSMVYRLEIMELLCALNFQEYRKHFGIVIHHLLDLNQSNDKKIILEKKKCRRENINERFKGKATITRTKTKERTDPKQSKKKEC